MSHRVCTATQVPLNKPAHHLSKKVSPPWQTLENHAPETFMTKKGGDPLKAETLSITSGTEVFTKERKDFAKNKQLHGLIEITYS